MTQEQKIIRAKVGLLELAKQPQNPRVIALVSSQVSSFQPHAPLNRSPAELVQPHHRRQFVRRQHDVPAVEPCPAESPA